MTLTNMFLTMTAVATLMMGFGGITAHAEEGVEVLHWWTSGGEAAALDVLKKDLESKGISWVDMPVAGGGGTEAMTVLRARVTAGNAPTAVQMLGFDKQPETWDELVALLDNFKEQGITPVAHGGQPWQDATIFDAVVLSLGNDFYKQVFIDLDPAALGSDKMKEAFDRMSKLRVQRGQGIGAGAHRRLG